VKVKIDENLPLEACALFRDAGFDALSVRDQQLTGAPDPEVYAICQRERRVLITLDVGFADIQTYLPAPAAGIIVLRLRLQSRPAVLSVIQALISFLALERIEGRLWIVDEQRVRVRS
jgi:predicted nuclease of predicted toxin-antitoxin system